MGDEREWADVAEENTSQDDVAELAAGGLHHRRVTVLEKDEGDEKRNQDTDAGETHCDDGLHVAPLQVFERERFAF